MLFVIAFLNQVRFVLQLTKKSIPLLTQTFVRRSSLVSKNYSHLWASWVVAMNTITINIILNVLNQLLFLDGDNILWQEIFLSLALHVMQFHIPKFEVFIPVSTFENWNCITCKARDGEYLLPHQDIISVLEKKLILEYVVSWYHFLISLASTLMQDRSILLLPTIIGVQLILRSTVNWIIKIQHTFSIGSCQLAPTVSLTRITSKWEQRLRWFCFFIIYIFLLEICFLHDISMWVLSTNSSCRHKKSLLTCSHFCQTSTSYILAKIVWCLKAPKSHG